MPLTFVIELELFSLGRVKRKMKVIFLLLYSVKTAKKKGRRQNVGFKMGRVTLYLCRREEYVYIWQQDELYTTYLSPTDI